MTRPKPPEGATARITIVLPAEALERMHAARRVLLQYRTATTVVVVGEGNVAWWLAAVSRCT
jgi:hypothetical protein